MDAFQGWVWFNEMHAKAACNCLQAAFANVLLVVFVLIRQWDGEAEGFAVAVPNAEFVFFTVVDEFEAGGGFAQGFGAVAIVVGNHGGAGGFGESF